MVDKLSVQIELVGGAEVEKQLADIGTAGQKAFSDIEKAAQGGGGFQAATKSIGALGATASEALGAAAAAAQKFGASANELAGVESVIRALGARARDSGTAFSELAANYDKARVSASSFAAVNKEVGTSLATLVTRATIVGTAFAAVVTAITVAAKATLAFAETIQKASAEAVKLGLTLEQFDKQRQGLEKLGLSTKAATQGLQELGKAVEQVKLDAITKAIKELEEASARGFGAQGTAQLKLLQETANGVGPAADAARAGLEKLSLAAERKIEFGMAIPPGMVLTLKDFITVMGDGDKAMQAFQAQLRGMPDGLQRTNLAIAGMGPAGLQFIQSLRLAEGSMTPVEAKAETLRQATERLSTEWGKFGSLTFSPAVVQGVDAATSALRGLDSVLTNMNWSAVGTAASVALNPLPNLIQLLGGAIVNLGSQFSGAGQAATQTGQQGAQSLQSLTAAAGSAAQQMALLGQTGAQAGQQAAQGLQLVTNPLTGMPELINTANQALAQTGQAGAQAGQQAGQGFQVWNDELGKAVPKTQEVTTATQQAATAVSDFISKIGSITWDVISSAGVAAWNAITGAIQGAIDALLKFIGLKPSAPATGGGAPAAARGGLLGGRGTGTSDSNLAWVSRGEHIMPARVVAQPGVLSFLEALRRGGGIPGFAEGGSVGGSGGQFINSMGNAINSIKQIWDNLVNGMQEVYITISELSNMIGQSLLDVIVRIDRVVQTTGESLQKLQINLAEILGATISAAKQEQGQARGGLLGGNGTGTSDSNLAWVSRGEYITPARAVAQPGVLAFLEALRRSGGNLSAVLNGMGRFALGGMIRGPMPAFASGGLAGGMSNVTIQFPGLPAIGGLRASSDVVDQLHRAAALAQVRSGGRKPSRYS